MCELIVRNTLEKNPSDTNGETPLHMAAVEGHFDVYKAIMDHVEDKNPKEMNDWTPLHLAATNGFGRICELIIANVKDKNPIGHLHGDMKSARECWIETKSNVIGTLEHERILQLFV